MMIIGVIMFRPARTMTRACPGLNSDGTSMEQPEQEVQLLRRPRDRAMQKPATVVGRIICRECGHSRGLHECDRRTDGHIDRQTDMFTMTKTALCIASRRKNCFRRFPKAMVGV